MGNKKNASFENWERFVLKMNRVPLRPLAKILDARRKGVNPSYIEKNNIDERYITSSERSRKRSDRRLFFVGIMFLMGFMLVCARMTVMASSEIAEPLREASSSKLTSQRSNIVDRNGNILATNLPTIALYANPKIILRPEIAVEKLSQVFPELDSKKLLKEFKSDKTFLWIKETLSPEQQQAVHEIGEPGLMYGPREMRLYPNGRFASHILGGTRFNNQSARNADMVGSAGIEATFNDFLSDRNNNGEPLQLSLDLSVQAAVERILGGSMEIMNAKGASGVVLDVITGEIISMVSLPDFDPNDRPKLVKKSKPSDSPLFNRAVQGLYELGSTFKVFTVAKALELGLVGPETQLEFPSKMKIMGVLVKDDHYKGPILTVADVVSQSSNVGTAILASKIGKDHQINMLRRLGLLDATELELIEAGGIKPLKPRKWTDMSTVTISFGYGLSVSPLHLAVAYASLVNGGYKVKPSILRVENQGLGERVVSKKTSDSLRQILRLVVQEGTASLGKVNGYDVGGKTGTAEKQKEGEPGYDKDRVISTFASFFPVNRPRYVLVVSFDEPSYKGGKLKKERSAGWTAVPVSSEIIKRIAPLLDLRPSFEVEKMVQFQ